MLKVPMNIREAMFQNGLEYKTAHAYDYVTIAPHSSHLGFIILEVSYGGSNSELNITTGDEGEEGNSMNVYLGRPHHGI